MFKTKRVIRSVRFKYSTLFKRIITSPNCILLTIFMGVVTLLFTVQNLDDDYEDNVSNLDDFQAATYYKVNFRPTFKPVFHAETIIRNRNSKTKVPTTVKSNFSKITNHDSQSLPQVPSPKVLFPVIKVKYFSKLPRVKKKATEVKLVSPKKSKFSDVFRALAYPKLFPQSTETFPRNTDVHITTGLNDWIRANNPRDRNKFLVYSAYWDDRFDHANNVRIMAVMITKNPPTVFCRVQMSDGSTMNVPVVKKIMNEHWRLRYASYFLTCELRKNNSAPLRVLVSLQRNFTYSAMLPVYQNKENLVSPRGDIAVCVKPFHYHYERATWLLEFIEFHRILGVEHFFFYNHTVGSKVDALLRNYIQRNVVTVLPWNLPVRSQKEIRTEGIFSALNDCAYRTMYLFHYVVMLDFDEYIIPREHESYQDMIHQLEEDNKRIRGKPGSFVFRNTFFYLYWENDTTVYGVEPEKPPAWMPYFVTQYKTRRLTTSMKTGSRSKFILVPERVIEVGNHVVWRHTSGSRAIQVPDMVGLLHHYRICEFGGFGCLKKPSLVDRTATKFGPELLQRTLRQCRLIYPDLGGKCPLSPPLGSPW